MADPAFTTPPTAPSRNDDKATFIARANAFLAWLGALGVELQAFVPWVVAKTDLAVASAASALADAATATAAALAAVNAPGTTATSTTSNTIGTGDKSFTIQTGKSIVEGQGFSAAAAAPNAANRMTGFIKSYDPATGALVLTITQPSGSGTFTSWKLGLAAVNNIAGRHALWIPAGSMTSRQTTGAAPGAYETAGNKVMVRSLDFDPATIEYAQFAARMPKSWNEGTVSAVFVWSHAATTTNFKTSWGIQARAVGDNEALDGAFGTAIYANDTGGVTDNEYATPETASVTIAGAIAAEDLVIFQVLRKADDATNDTLAIDARLVGVTIYLTTDAESDA